MSPNSKINDIMKTAAAAKREFVLVRKETSDNDQFDLNCPISMQSILKLKTVLEKIHKRLEL